MDEAKVMMKMRKGYEPSNEASMYEKN